MYYLNAILFACFFGFVASQLRLCAVEDDFKNECKLLTAGSRTKCVFVSDSVDCALKLKNNESDFGVFTAEQILAVAEELRETTTVVASLPNEDKKGLYEFESVVVVRRTTVNGKNDLQGKRFCHPGFKYEDKWSPHVITSFEKSVVPKNCIQNDTFAAHDDIQSFSDFFGPSCRPGKWVEDKKVDLKLKSNYSRLCELCDDSTKCEYRESNWHLSALKCLTENNGDVTYVSYDHSREYFNTRSDVDDYVYLCPNGTTISIQAGKSCPWIRQPWPVVIAKKDKESDVLNLLRSELLSRTIDLGVQLRKIITVGDTAKTIIIVPSENPQQFIEKAREIPKPTSDTDKCRRKITWCTVSKNETEKCEMLSKVAFRLGIQPHFDCFNGYFTVACLYQINQTKADIISIDSNYGYIARHNFNLAPIVYNAAADEKSTILAVVKSDSNLERVQKLKNKKACFPEYGGIAWISFIRAAREKKVLLQTCDYGKAVSSFFEAACVPGADDRIYHGVTNGTDSGKLCKQCSSGCSANTTNPYYGDMGALKCLSEGQGDVAFIEKNNVAGDISQNNYRVLCRNGDMAKNTGFDVDPECALSVTVDSETLTRRKDADSPKYELFMDDLEYWFGSFSNKKYMSAMNMFSSFNGNRDLLFKENTVGFDYTDNPNNEYTKNYRELFKHLDGCISGNGASTQITPARIFVALCLAALIYFK